MVCAAIDLGSNSFICLIFRVNSDGHIQTLHDEVVLTRLSQGVDQDKTLAKDALDRAESAFKRFSELFKKFKVTRVLGVATSAARDAKNQKEFLDLAARYQIPVEILSGNEEAQMTFQGVRDYFLDQPGVIVDIGGGSTEYILAQSGEIKHRVSLNLGAVRFTERFNASESFPSGEQVVRAHIQDVLNASPGLQNIRSFNPLFLLAVSGTPTNAVALIQGGFNERNVEGFKLTQQHLDDLMKNYAYKTLKQRLQGYPFIEEKRADVLPVGLAILDESMKFFALDSYVVSTRGIRHGAAKKMVQS